jgi:hypothetical protein
MEHSIEWTGDIGVLGDIVPYELKAIVASEMRDVVRAAGDEVIQTDDRMAVAEEAIREMRAEESSGSSYENSHAAPPRPIE